MMITTKNAMKGIYKKKKKNNEVKGERKKDEARMTISV